MPDPTVSVVIPHYGAPELTVALCAQLRDQGVDGGMEIIVADDCSPHPFPEVDGVLVVRRQTNGGFGSAVNSGAARARGDLLLVLNSDVDLPPRFVADLVAAARPFQPGVFGPVVRTNGVIRDTARLWPTPRRVVAERLELLGRTRHSNLGRRIVGIDVGAEGDAVQPCDWVAGVALLVPRAAFEAVGGFDEAYFMYSEEIDLQRRLTDRGLTSARLGSVEVGHLGGASSDPARVRAWIAESHLRYFRTWGGARRLQTGLVAVACLNLVSSSARRVLGRPTNPVATFRRDLHELGRARAAVRGHS